MLLDGASITLAPLSISRAKVASNACAESGRGVGHPADLTFGDCFSYALAKETGQPPLLERDDFTHTDEVRAVG